MERLWSPWRLTYVTAASTTARCVFCDAAAAGPLAARPADAPDDLVLVRTPLAYVILNLYPYNSGHLMVVPNRHVGSLSTATPEELSAIMRLTRDAEAALNDVYQPQGVNVGMNLGRPAGAGIVDHIHMHVVPRWTGDTNFMSVLGEIRVLPEDLAQTAARLRPVFERIVHNRRSE
jgi:ATP adenylyltransferase